MKAVLAASLLAGLQPVAAHSADGDGRADAPAPASAMLEQRAHELVALMNGDGAASDTFAASFLAAIPEQKLRDLFAQVTGQLGKATGVARLEANAPTHAAIAMQFERGTANLSLTIAPPPDGRIIGLYITGLQPADAPVIRTFEDMTAAFAKLPGHSGLAIVDLSAPGRPLAASKADVPLALGSAFKLVVLAELTREVAAGGCGWDDQVTLDGTELPAGKYRGLPPGTKVSLRSLAEAMISVSDNSAADLLIGALGRGKVEAMQAELGIRDPAANVPFLKTMELFKLKGVDGGALGRRYLALPAEQRHKLLDEEVANIPGSAVGALFADGKPVMIDRIEWFASPMDLVRIMAWFRDHAGTPAGDEALRILAINPGPGAGAARDYAYIGYKGGSEPGVLNMTLLLRLKAGAWKVIAAGWNDSDENAVSELSFAQLVTQAAVLAAQ